MSGWAGVKMFCPLCGHELELITEPDPRKAWREPDEYLCHNKNCNMYAEGPGEGGELTLFQPVYGIDSPAGDSWAIGWIK